MTLKPIAPCLWFKKDAEAAAKFYCSVFPKSKVLWRSYYGEAGSQASGCKKGALMVIAFRLNGCEFMAFNAERGSGSQFGEAISFVVYCKTQKEIDAYWKKLTAGGGKGIFCGWLADKFGVRWQIVPEELGRLTSGKDAKKCDRVMRALYRMKKLDLAALRKAAAGK